MSGLFGVVHLDGGPPPHGVVDALISAMGPWGRERVTLVRESSAVVGHALTLETPEDAFTATPVQEPALLLAAEGRLDGRLGVARALGIDADDARAMADSALMARAYRHWGPACAQHLVGEWSLAAWHPEDRRVTLARDHAGNTSLFVWLDRDRHLVVFASGMRPIQAALRAAGVTPTVDEYRLAAMLTSWPGTDLDHTHLVEVVRVPPGHVAWVDPDSIRQQRYWHPEHVAIAAGMTLQDAATGVREVLGRAVIDQCRSSGEVASMLSGGLDSGFVTALAADILHGTGRELTAFTSVPATSVEGKVDPAMFGDEAALAAATTAMARVDRHVLVDGSRITPVAGIELALEAMAAPLHPASNAFWAHETFLRMRDPGIHANTLLTGHAGNGTISWSGREYPTTLRGRWQDKGITGVIAHVLPESLQRRRMAHVLGTAGWPNSAIAPEFAERLDLATAIAASLGGDGQLPSARADGMRQRTFLFGPGRGRIGDIYSAAGAYWGVDARDPTADPRVAEFCFSIPDRLHRGPLDAGGPALDRRVIRLATAGLLPDPVRLNPRLGWQSADLVARLRATRDEVASALDEVSGGLAAEYLSLAAMRQAWAEVESADDHATTHRARALLLRGLSAGLWINRTFR